MEKRIKVTIEDMKWIPSIGKGPVRNPISITHDQYNLLKLLGFNVIPYEEKVKVEPIELPKKENNIEKVEEEIKEEVKEEPQEVVEEEIIEETAEEVVEDEEEIVEEEEVKEEPQEVVEETLDVNSMTKKQLKAELDSRNISYAYNATAEQLKTLLSENL